jgi:hypothetical protein
LLIYTWKANLTFVFPGANGKESAWQRSKYRLLDSDEAKYGELDRMIATESTCSITLVDERNRQ